MSFTDHKITSFQHRIADLPDEPQLPAADLKSRFDACPEELRQSLNAVCDDAARLEARVEGIVVDTFGDTIDKEMLSDELAEKIDQIDTLVAHDHEIHYGFYTGNGTYPRTITLGFTPKMVYVARSNGKAVPNSYICACLALPETNEAENNIPVKIIEGGFTLLQTIGERSYLNNTNELMCYITIK